VTAGIAGGDAAPGPEDQAPAPGGGGRDTGPGATDPGAGTGVGGRGTGSGRAGPGDGALAAFDAVADAAVDRLRGRPAVDATARVLSNLADYGFVWAVLAAVKGRRAGSARRRAVSALALAGVASYGVNRAVKASVQRVRPDGADRAAGVRTPTSSSFPSGHTLAACCTAVLLADSPGETAAYLTFATAVAASRVHLRAHHASDVLGGALIGAALGVAGRHLLPRRRR
jgi:undecaprenyl-diphosphatase